MRFYSGFGFWNEKELFKEYLEEGEFVVAGFSYGAQKALIDAVHTSKRVDKLLLLSPAFFNLNSKAVNLQLNAFRKDKESYCKKFREKLFYPLPKSGVENYFDECFLEDLEEMFNFNWGLMEHLNRKIKVEVFIGAEDKIIDVKKAVQFFKRYGDIYLFKELGHLL